MKGYRKLPLAARMDGEGFAVSSATHITNQRLTCVAVKIDAGGVQVRNNLDPMKNTLTFTHDEWKAFIAGAKEGEFDL